MRRYNQHTADRVLDGRAHDAQPTDRGPFVPAGPGA